MVYPRFKVSAQPFFIFSGLPDKHFLKEASKVIYFICEFGSLLVELEKWPLQNEVALGLDYG